MYNPKFRKEQVEPFPVARDDLTIRKYYKPIIEKTNYVMEPMMLIGTVEGKVTICVAFSCDSISDRWQLRPGWDAARLYLGFINVNAIQIAIKHN